MNLIELIELDKWRSLEFVISSYFFSIIGWILAGKFLLKPGPSIGNRSIFQDSLDGISLNL